MNLFLLFFCWLRFWECLEIDQGCYKQWQYYRYYYLRQGGDVFAGFCLFVCLFVCQQHNSKSYNSKSYGRIFLKFWGYVGRGNNYQWFNFGGDPTGILDSGSLLNFCYHCVKGGIREPLAKWIWWRHLTNSFALAEVPAGYDCFLVLKSYVPVWHLLLKGSSSSPCGHSLLPLHSAHDGMQRPVCWHLNSNTCDTSVSRITNLTRRLFV